MFRYARVEHDVERSICKGKRCRVADDPFVEVRVRQHAGIEIDPDVGRDSPPQGETRLVTPAGTGP